MSGNFYYFINPLQSWRRQPFINPTWILGCSLLVYVVCYYQLSTPYWLRIAVWINFLIYLGALYFKASRFIAIILLVWLLIFNFDCFKPLQNPLPQNYHLKIDELSGEVARKHDNRLTLVKVQVAQPTIAREFFQAEISFAPDIKFLQSRFKVKERYIFKNITVQKADWPLFEFARDSKYIPISAIKKRLRQSFFYEYLLATVDYYLAGDAKNVIKTIVLNDRRQISDELSNKFSIIGIYHLFSISALHLVQIFLFCQICYYLLLLLVRFGPDNIYLNSLPEIGALITCLYYVALIGYPIPAVRALLFLTAWVATKNFLPYMLPLFRLMIIATIMVTSEVWIVGSLSFGLSFLAVLGLILIFGLMAQIVKFKEKWWQKIKAYLATVFLGSAMIGIFSLPIQLLFLQGINFLQPLSNLFHIPFASLIVIPFAFLLLPIVGLEYMEFFFSPWLSEIYFRGLQLLIDFWLQLVELNYLLTSFANWQTTIKNPMIFAWSWALLMSIISLFISYQTVSIRTKKLFGKR